LLQEVNSTKLVRMCYDLIAVFYCLYTDHRHPVGTKCGINSRHPCHAQIHPRSSIRPTWHYWLYVIS